MEQPESLSLHPDEAGAWLRERDALLEALWEAWQGEGGLEHVGPTRRQLTRRMFERQVLTVGSGEDVRVLSARSRAYFAREAVLRDAARVVELEARLARVRDPGPDAAGAGSSGH